MQLPERTIKAAILSQEEEIRAAAVAFFSGSFSRDEAVMPLVIEAVERFGRDKAFRILRKAEHLRQTHATVDWLAGELHRDYDLADLDQDNYRFAVALVLCHTEPEILLPWKDAIVALPMFPAELRCPLKERFETLSWDWDRAWAALQSFGQATMRKAAFTTNDLLYADRVIESLASHWAVRGAFVLGLLQRHGHNGALISWMRPWIIRLAGAMQLQAATPLLVVCLCDDDVSVADESTTALIKMDADAVVLAIAERWWDANPNFRAAACDVLENIHTELCTESCLRFLSAEEAPETELCLAHAVLAQFVEEGLQPVRQLVLARAESRQPNELDIRYRLVVASTVLGVSFPEYEQWRREAETDNWGMGDYRPPRLSDGFR